MAKTFALIGAGPYTGLSTARRFGQDGHRVAMVARRRESLDQMARSLGSDGIEARGFPADICDHDSLRGALAEISEAFGPVDVLLFAPHQMEFTPPTRVTEDLAQQMFDFLVKPAIICVQDVLPDMLERGDGALLLTTGRSAIQPMKMLGGITLATAAVRAYFYELHDELRPTGVYAGVVTISALIDRPHAERIAEIVHDLVARRDRIEVVYGDDTEAITEISRLTQAAVLEYPELEGVPRTVEGFDALLQAVRAQTD
jgi:NADP-dependent 3-hydroxy acid dehydrogenase YdfG